MLPQTLKNFLKLESTAGILLVIATAVALLVSNSPLLPIYRDVLGVPLQVALGDFAINKPLLLWINDGLMAIFFLLIGLEVKREVLEGELSSPDQILLPAAGAVGGFVLPALIYTGINWNNPETLAGWAVPVATDIAGALFGTVSLGIAAGLFFGKQVGVFVTVWAMVKCGWARLPNGVTWMSVYGVSLLTGIGFTMSLFIGSLAFERGEFDYVVATRVGVLAGSFASAVAGFLVLSIAGGKRAAGEVCHTS